MLLELGVLQGTAPELVERRAHKRYTIHGPGDWLGLDVHDVGRAIAEGRPRPFVPGMVLTIEPGLYLPPDDQDVPPELRGQAVRIEDDAVVTDEGCRLVTRDLPVAADAIAALVGAQSAR